MKKKATTCYAYRSTRVTMNRRREQNILGVPGGFPDNIPGFSLGRKMW